MTPTEATARTAAPPDVAPTCDWVDWCTRRGDQEVVMSNAAGTERMPVCRLHVGPARLHGYGPVIDR